MSFLQEMLDFASENERDMRAIKDAAVDIAFESIVEGSSITGALGQPIGDDKHAGKLHDSWKKTVLDTNSTEISTDLEYAHVIEDDERHAHFTNHGPHSLRSTIVNAGAVVAVAIARVVT